MYILLVQVSSHICQLCVSSIKQEELSVRRSTRRKKENPRFPGSSQYSLGDGEEVVDPEEPPELDLRYSALEEVPDQEDTNNNLHEVEPASVFSVLGEEDDDGEEEDDDGEEEDDGEEDDEEEDDDGEEMMRRLRRLRSESHDPTSPSPVPTLPRPAPTPPRSAHTLSNPALSLESVDLLAEDAAE